MSGYDTRSDRLFPLFTVSEVRPSPPPLSLIRSLRSQGEGRQSVSLYLHQKPFPIKNESKGTNKRVSVSPLPARNERIRERGGGEGTQNLSLWAGQGEI